MTPSLHLLGLALAGQRRQNRWLRDVARVQEDLAGLNRQTEEDFLAIGRELGNILGDSRQLHAQAMTLTEMASGRAAGETGDALAAAREYMKELQRRGAEARQTYVALREAAGRIRSGFAGLSKVALGFQMAAIVARIETAGLGLSSDDVSHLTDEVRDCSSGIQARAEQVSESAASLTIRIDLSLEQGIERANRQDRDLPALLEMIDADLAAMAERQAAADRETNRLAEEAEGVSADLSAILMSLQSQDITRQQLEHVLEGLAAVTVHSRWGVLTPDGAEVIELQRAQLRGAAETFLRSINGIDRGLRDLAARVEAMAGLNRESHQADSKQSAFLESMERRLTLLAEALAELQAAEQAASAGASELHGVSQELEVSVAEIQSIEIQLHHIAINAALAACHIGPPADPLGVVAEALRRLQMDCSLCSDQATEDLAAVRQAIGSLSEQSAAQDLNGAMVVRSLRERMSLMRDSAAAAEAGGDGVRQVAEAIGDHLREARGRLSVGARFAETMERAQTRLAAALQQAQSPWFYQRTGQAGVPPRYTMESERAIHATAQAGETAPAVEAAAPVTNEVEFF